MPSSIGVNKINEDNVITEVSESVRVPHTESVFETVQEHYFAFPSGQPHHFRRSGNCCYLSGAWETVEFIQNFVNCQSSVRSSRESKYINVPHSVWDGCRHILRKAGSQKQQFALWVITSENLANCSDPGGMGWPCMCWPDGSRSQQPYGTGDQKLSVGKSVRQKCPPCTPSKCSGEQLVDCILMCGFGQPELSDALLPIICHGKGGAIHFQLRMILKENVVLVVRA